MLIGFLNIALLVILLGMAILLYLSDKRNKKLTDKFKRNLKYAGEEKYLELTDLLSQVVFETDKTGRIKFLNSFAMDTFGLNRIDIQNGINIKDFISVNEVSRFWEDFLYTAEGGLNKGQEYNVTTNNMKSVPMLFYMSQILKDAQSQGVRGIAIDITDRKLLEQKLFSAVIETEDRERQRFAEDLHDGLGPLLSAIRLYFNQMQLENLRLEEKNNLIQTTYDLIDEAILTTKSIANNILPGAIIDHGLIPAIRAFCSRIESTGIIQINLTSNLKVRLSNKIENTIYRIIIELINNTIKHAYAENINIDFLLIDDFIEIQYRDDGKGFDINQNSTGLGLPNIINRCHSIDADLNIKTEIGKGFQLIMNVRKI